MKECILITGGAGFVGSHLAERLLHEGYQVRVLDNLTEQVHGQTGWPDYLSPRVERLLGDVRDPAMVREALEGVAAVFHFAAAIGVGQSMYQIEHYTDVNNRGTAVLLEAMTLKSIKKLVVASSMSVYGEGYYRDQVGNLYAPEERHAELLNAGEWDMRIDNEPLQPVPTPERKAAAPASVYALSKYDQERLCLIVGAAYNIPVTALRFFNIYGPHQALSNPYTGVLAIFASRFLHDQPPLIFEDGNQQRDFVSVHDVARACVLALENDNANGEVFNIGSGEHYSIKQIATRMGQVLQRPDVKPIITEEYRLGDIRHCFADIQKARSVLDYHPRVSLADGLQELAEWLQSQQPPENRVAGMRYELSSRGLSR
jgi:dTDP-L-rhamnose 4-epimerase